MTYNQRMSTRALLEQARKLPTAQRVLLVERIWDSIAEEQASAAPTAELMRELDRRDDELERHPEIGLTWEQVRTKIRKKARRSA